MADAVNPDRLPLEIEDIDAEWLTWALSQQTPGVEVRDCEIVDVRHGFTTLIRVRIDVNDVGRDAGIGPTIMVKGGFEEFTRGKLRAYSMKGYSLEVVGYRDIWPVLGLNTPKCLFADMELEVESERQQTIIIMEDLVGRDVTFSHGLRPQSPEQVRRRLSSLAALHAQTWGSPDVQPGGRWDFVGQNGQAMFIEYMKHAGFVEPAEWESLCGLPRGAASSVRFHDLDWMMHALEYMTAQSDELPSCIIHGDMHLGNLYEEPDGTPGFLDALPRREPGMVEVTYHLVCALDPVDRQAHDRSLVAHYRDELLTHGADAPDLDELMRQFAVYLPYGWVTFLVNSTNWQTESFNTAHAMRFSAAMVDHDSRGVIPPA